MVKIVALVLALLLGVVLPRSVSCFGQGLGQELPLGGYWPLFHRDQRRTGLSPFPGPSKGVLRCHFKTLKPIDSSPVIGRDGTVYFGCLDGKFYAVSPQGTLLWSFSIGDKIYYTPALTPGGDIYCCSWGGKVFALDAQGNQSGRAAPVQKWLTQIPGRISSSPALNPGGGLYVGSDNYNLYALDNAGGVTWVFTTRKYIEAPPAVAPDGTIYFGPTEAYLYALSPGGTLRGKSNTGGASPSSRVMGVGVPCTLAPVT